jgi:transglutaminase-like putative cysteine protease
VPARERRRGSGSLRLTIALWLALLAALLPLGRVVEAGGWVMGSAALALILLAVGFGLRRAGLPAVGVSLLEALVWLGVVCAVFFAPAAVLWVVPTPEAGELAIAAVQSAMSEILYGVAPLPSTAAVSFVIVAAVGVLTVALDHVVLTARMPLLAAVAFVAVWLIPSLAVPGDVDAGSFILLAAALLYLIRSETRTRETPGGPRRTAGVTAVATTIGVVAIVVAMVGGQALPAPVAAGVGAGRLASIDPTLDLGDDLRRLGDDTVLTVRTDATDPPYLRVATLSAFDGEVWVPDRVNSVPVEEFGFEPVGVTEGVRVTEYRTMIEITGLSSAYLPVPYPTVEIAGLEGAWRTQPYNRTVLTGQSNAQGETYDVVTHVPRPSLEQIRSSRAVIAENQVSLSNVPVETPQLVFDLAQAVTAGAETDYDRLLALQSWFRGPEFAYSLTAPVEEGFDGSGVIAVRQFLEEKTGYCIHFASAFALMARVLDMPTRIVVGFLPAGFSEGAAQGDRVAEYSTNQLHSWPEVHFDGLGWIAFEPTKSLGVATRFAADAEAAADAGGEDILGPTPAATATATASAAPLDEIDQTGGQAAGSATPLADLRPFLYTVAVALLLMLTPGVVRAVRLRVLRARGRRGQVAAAWRIVQDAAIDLGDAAPGSETPRTFAARIVAEFGAPPAETQRLVAAVERANYAPAGTPTGGERFTADAEAIRTAMLAAVDGRARARALLLPRSLVLRPGSALIDRPA